MNLLIGPAHLADGTPGIRLYCPRCDTNLGTWPALDLTHAQHEAEQHTIHGLELLREANDNVLAEALTEYYQRRPVTEDPDALAIDDTHCPAVGPEHIVAGVAARSGCLYLKDHHGHHRDPYGTTW